MIIKLKQTVQYLVLGIMFMFSVSDLYGQQEPQYSQFMYNKLQSMQDILGSREVLSLRALYRNQWSGITGAPQTGNIL